MNHVQGAPHIKKSLPPITFTDEDFAGVDLEGDPMDFNWNCMLGHEKDLIDGRSSIDIVFLSTFKRLDISPKLIKPYLEPLIGFVEGQVTLMVLQNSKPPLEWENCLGHYSSSMFL